MKKFGFEAPDYLLSCGRLGEKYMRKIVLFIVLSLMMLTLVACTGGQGREATPVSSVSSAEASVSASGESSTASSAAGEAAVGASANTGSSTSDASTSAPNISTAGSSTPNTSTANILLVSSGDMRLEATLEDNVATAELVALLQEGPITVNLHEYGGFEMIGGLPQSLPTADEQISTSTGDIVLYQGKQISFFYASNNWSYTRLGHIDGYNSAALLEALGGPYDSTVELSLKE